MIYLILLTIFIFAIIGYAGPYLHMVMGCAVVAFFVTGGISNVLLWVIGEIGAGSLMVLIVAGTAIFASIARFNDKNTANPSN